MNESVLKITPKKFADRYCRFAVCPSAENFVRERETMAQVWDDCEDIGFLLFILDKIGYENEKALRLFAVWCACETRLVDGRKTGDLMTDKRSAKAIEAAVRHANGEATDKELEEAHYEAFSAAEDCENSYVAKLAETASSVKAKYAAFDTAKESVDFAAEYAAIFADKFDYNTATYKSAFDSTRKIQLDKFRSLVENPFS